MTLLAQILALPIKGYRLIFSPWVKWRNGDMYLVKLLFYRGLSVSLYTTFEVASNR